MNPHELLAEFLGFHLGNRMALFGPFLDDLFLPLAQAVADELSIYLSVRPFAKLRVGDVRVREGRERSYLLIPVTDRHGPLDMRGTFARWEQPIRTNRAEDWVADVNGRRWFFIGKCLSSVMEPLLRRVADSMTTYYVRKPYTVPKAGILRWIESVDQTFLVAEVDDRSLRGPRESASRYLIQ